MLQVRILPGLLSGGFEETQIMIKQVGNFIQETKQELNKVTWPSRDELWQSTVVVIVTTLLMALFIGIVDLILSMVMRFLLG